MMNIIEQAGEFLFFNEVTVMKKLPVRNYELNWNKLGCFLRSSPDFTLPTDLFEVDTDFRDQVKKSVEHLSGNLGVLLGGYKGQVSQ